MDGNKDEVRKEEAAVQSEQKDAEIKPNGTALFPFIVFVGVYLGPGSFYKCKVWKCPFISFLHRWPLSSVLS